MSPKLCVMQSFHREIKLGLKKSIFGSDYLWQEILSCFFFFFFNIFLWTSLLSGAKVGNSNIEGMPKILLEFHSSNWRMALPPFFQFFFFFSPKESVASPVPSLFFFWNYWLWFEFVSWFSCHSPDCETPLSRRYSFQLAQTFWPELFRPKVDPWPKVKSCKFVQSYVRSNDELDIGDFLLDTWK